MPHQISHKFANLSIRTQMIGATVLTLVFILIASTMAWLGYRSIEQANTLAMHYANESTLMQRMIKDLNQLLTTEGAKPVRERLREAIGVFDQALDKQALLDTRFMGDAPTQLIKNWQEIKVNVEAITREQSISLDNDDVLIKLFKLVTRLDGLAGDIDKMAASAHEHGASTAQKTVMLVGGVFAMIVLLIALTFWGLYRGILGQLGAEPQVVRQLIQTIAKGDLKVDVARYSRRQGTHLLQALGEMVQRLNHVIRSINDTNKQLEQSAFQIATMSRDIYQSHSAQQSNFEEVSVATQNLAKISDEVFALAEQIKAKTTEMESGANASITTVNQNIAEMDKTVSEVGQAEQEMETLGQAAHQIHNIIASISDIADQTNLLALNAAIEAARAGEQGRGFAVVADEVRKLANRTSTATNEIATIVESLTAQVDKTRSTMGRVVASVNGGQQRAGDSAETIRQMVIEVQAAGCANIEISEGTRHQTDQLDDLNQRLQSLFQTLRDSESKVGVTSTISEDLHRTVLNVEELLSYFNFDHAPVVEQRLNDKRRAPRAHNSLLVYVEENGRRIEAVAEDFSLTGMHLCAPFPLSSRAATSLYLMIPNTDLQAYEDQTPLHIDARIVWSNDANGRHNYGIEFQNLSAAARQKLDQCFAFFNKKPTFD